MEARAIAVMRAGNLIFKNWAPHKIIKKHMGDLKCLVPICQEKDSLAHVLNCEFYDTKFIETSEGNIRDWATYLVKLNNERIDKFDQPLISCEGWSTISQWWLLWWRRTLTIRNDERTAESWKYDGMSSTVDWKDDLSSRYVLLWFLGNVYPKNCAQIYYLLINSLMSLETTGKQLD